MEKYNETLRKFAVDLYKIDAIKFGEYKMKVGMMSPIYCDLRVIVSQPEILDTLADLIIEKIKETEDSDLICGVPYTALPIATAVSLKTKIPMVLRRKEAKDYGTKKIIEGKYEKDNKCIIIEDVITSGGSILETIQDLDSAELVVQDVFVVLNREQGGEERLKDMGYKVCSLLTITQLMEFLLEAKCVDQETVDKVQDYIESSKVVTNIGPSRLYITFDERAEYCKNKVGKKLLELMHKKETNLCLAADLKRADDILAIAERLAKYICILKIHVDIIDDFDSAFITKLKRLSEEGDFLLMEDRKFGDIGNTASLQFNCGLYSIASWADLVTVHALPGDGVIKALTESSEKDVGLFLIGEMSSEGSLTSPSYAAAVVKMALEFPEAVAGVVCQNAHFASTPGLLQLTPGIRIDKESDDWGQQYNSPEYVVLERGADIGVVGRGIIEAENPEEVAEDYRRRLWNYLIRRVYE